MHATSLCVKYSLDSIKRTVHLAFHGLFFLIFQKIFIKNTVYTKYILLKTVLLIETVRLIEQYA